MMGLGEGGGGGASTLPCVGGGPRGGDRPNGDFRGGENGEERAVGPRHGLDDEDCGGEGGSGGLRPLTEDIHADSRRSHAFGGVGCAGDSTGGPRRSEGPSCVSAIGPRLEPLPPLGKGVGLGGGGVGMAGTVTHVGDPGGGMTIVSPALARRADT